MGLMTSKFDATYKDYEHECAVFPIVNYEDDSFFIHALSAG